MRTLMHKRAKPVPPPMLARAAKAPTAARVAQPRLPAHDISGVPIADISGRSATAQLRAARPDAAPAYRAPNRTELPDGLKAGIEARSDMSMDRVKVHYSSSEPAQLNAHAFTGGTDIHLAPGRQRHLPHQAATAVQQEQGLPQPQHTRAVALPKKGADGNAPIQRQINRQILVQHTKANWGMDSGFRKKLLAKLQRYNEHEKRRDRSKNNTHKNLAALDDIEHRIYQWFDENKTDTFNKNRYGLFQLLNEVQENHKYWVAVSVEEKHPMWTKDKAADNEEQERIDEIWSHIINGDGAFAFKDEVHTTTGEFKKLPDPVLAKLKTEVFAMLARLYSRPKGRELLKALDQGYADQKTISFVMSPIYKILGTGPKGYTDPPYVGAKATATSEGDAMVKLKGVKQKNLQVVRGKGSGAGVEIAPGIKDASMMDFDAAGNQILSPGFIGVGHELVHAAHYGAGSYIGMRPQAPQAPHAKIRGEYDNDVEEFVTIASQQERTKAKDIPVTATLDRLSEGRQKHTFKMSEWEKLNKGIPTEADIRSEHGLSIRHGHTTTANPGLYPGAAKGQDPGSYVEDAVKWITPHLDEISPPEQEPQAQDALDEQGVGDSALGTLWKWVWGL